MGKLCFGVDLGGTTVKMGVFTVEGSLLSDWEIPNKKKRKKVNIFLMILQNQSRQKLKKKLFHRRMLLVWESVFRVLLLQQA